MNDTANNNSHLDKKPATNAHLQDKLVKDSITHNQNITAQVQARQTTVKDSNHTASTNDFTQVKTYQLEHHKVNKPPCQTTIRLIA